MRAALWWIDRWRQSDAFARMTAEEQGLYRNLCDEVVLRVDGVIPDDQRLLAKASGDHEAWARSGKSVLRSMKKVKGGWTNETALKIKTESERRAKKQRDYRSGNASGNDAGNADGNESGNDVGNDPRPPEQEMEIGPVKGNGKAPHAPARPLVGVESPTTIRDGKLLDAILCPQCSKPGFLVQTPARNGNGAQFWCRRPSGGCGFSIPIEFGKEIIAQMTPGARKTIEAMLPKESKPYVSPGMIITSELKFDEKGALIE